MEVNVPLNEMIETSCATERLTIGIKALFSASGIIFYVAVKRLRSLNVVKSERRQVDRIHLIDDSPYIS